MEAKGDELRRRYIEMCELLQRNWQNREINDHDCISRHREDRDVVHADSDGAVIALNNIVECDAQKPI